MGEFACAPDERRVAEIRSRHVLGPLSSTTPSGTPSFRREGARSTGPDPAGSSCVCFCRLDGRSGALHFRAYAPPTLLCRPLPPLLPSQCGCRVTAAGCKAAVEGEK